MICENNIIVLPYKTKPRPGFFVPGQGFHWFYGGVTAGATLNQPSLTPPVTPPKNSFILGLVSSNRSSIEFPPDFCLSHRQAAVNLDDLPGHILRALA